MTKRPSCLLLAAILVVHLPATAANITVGGSCTLAAAIEAANNDDDAGGLCPPGGSGADVLELTDDVLLTAVDNNFLGDNGLPVISTDMTIAGNGYTIARDPGAPDFRLILVHGTSPHLALDAVTLANGMAVDGGAMFGAAGGALYNAFGTVDLFDSTLIGNTADNGGGMWSSHGHVTLTNTTISGNNALLRGGGIGIYTTLLTATNSTWSGNVAALNGGAIYAEYGTSVDLFNSTIASNTASAGGAIYSGFYSYVNAYGSAFGHNRGGACSSYWVTDGGGNAEDDGTCGLSGVLAGLDPTLADNGGPTETHTLLAGSSAIDAAGTCAEPLDQRGFARDASCDTGSVEFGAAPVGGAGRGVDLVRVLCSNLTTAQAVQIGSPEGAWSCESAGLVVSTGDRIRQRLVGLPSGAGSGATAIGLSQLRVRCANQTTAEQVSFEPSGTLSWSCAEEGLGIAAGDRILQLFDGVAD